MRLLPLRLRPHSRRTSVPGTREARAVRRRHAPFPSRSCVLLLLVLLLLLLLQEGVHGSNLRCLGVAVQGCAKGCGHRLRPGVGPGVQCSRQGAVAAVGGCARVRGVPWEAAGMRNVRWLLLLHLQLLRVQLNGLFHGVLWQSGIDASGVGRAQSAFLEQTKHAPVNSTWQRMGTRVCSYGEPRANFLYFAQSGTHFLEFPLHDSRPKHHPPRLQLGRTRFPYPPLNTQANRTQFAQCRTLFAQCRTMCAVAVPCAQCRTLCAQCRTRFTQCRTCRWPNRSSTLR